MANFTKLKWVVLIVLAVFVTNTAYSQQDLYFSEILFDKDGDEDTWQFIELRGTPNLLIDNFTYIGVIEGDDESGNAGQIKWWFDISGLTVGSNGYLVIRQKDSPYEVAEGATVVTGTHTDTESAGAPDPEFEGFKSLDAGAYDGSTSNGVVKGNIESFSQNFILFSHTEAVGRGSSGVYDSDKDGEKDVTWTILDQIATLDDDGVELGYGPLVYRFEDPDNDADDGDFNDDGLENNSNLHIESAAEIVESGNKLGYFARHGSTTGMTSDDWVATRIDDEDGSLVTIKNTTISQYNDMRIATIGGPNFAVTYDGVEYLPTDIDPYLDLIVDADLTTTGNMEVYSLTVEEGYDLVVATGHTLTINGFAYIKGYITIETGATVVISEDAVVYEDADLELSGTLTLNSALTIESGGGFLALSGSTLNGDVTFIRNTSYSDGRYSFVGSPVQADAAITGESLGASVYSYDETIGYDSDAGLSRWIDASLDPLSPGYGYTQAFQEVISFTGTPNQGDITLEGLTMTTTGTLSTDDQGWHLLSNPYGAALDVEAFLIENDLSIEGAIYLWDDEGLGDVRGDNGDYLAANAIATVGGPNNPKNFEGYIGSMQGFFVQVLSDNVDVTFTDDMLTIGDNTDATFFRTQNEVTGVKLALSTKDGLYNELFVGLTEDATLDKDRQYDATKLLGNENLQFYSLIADNKFAIQALPLEEGVATELAFNLGASDELNLSVVEMNGLQSGMNFFITDKITGSVYNLSEVNNFDFSSAAGFDQNRFTLSYGSSADILSTELSLSQPVYSYLNQELTARFAQSIEIESVVVYDMSGQILLKDETRSVGVDRKVSISKEGLNIVKFVTSEGTFTRKFRF